MIGQFGNSMFEMEFAKSEFFNLLI